MRRFLTFINGADSVPNSPSGSPTSRTPTPQPVDDITPLPEPQIQQNVAAGSNTNEHVSEIQDESSPQTLRTDGGSSIALEQASPVGEAERLTIQHPTQQLKNIVNAMRCYIGEEVNEEVRTDKSTITALKDLAEVMVWSDQHDVVVWDAFLEFAVMPLLVKCLQRTLIEKQILEEEQRKENEQLANVTDDNIEEEQNSGQALENGVTKPPNSQTSAHESTEISSEQDDAFDREFERIESKQPNGVEGSSNRERDTVPFSKDLNSASEAEQTSELNGEVNETEDSDGQKKDEKESMNVKELPVAVQAQVLQTISIMIQSVSRQQSLLCLFSANHINDILSFGFDFEHEETVAYFMSAVKSIALKLDAGLLQLFFNPIQESFPLYTAVTKFFDHPESMVRIAVRTVTLTIYATGDSEVLKFAAKDEVLYFQKTTDLLAKLCGSVARAFELLLDDGREIRRTRSRTGLFKRRVKIPELTTKLEEIENLCSYLGEVSTVSQAYLHPVVMNLISSRLFSPFFRPIASQASPEAMKLLRKKWSLSRSSGDLETQLALPLFDAAARCLVLSCILSYCKSSPLGSILVRDLCRPTSEFERRHVLHGLKAMATDITGTERVTFISLCTIEAFIACDATSKQVLRTLRYDFRLDDIEDLRITAANGISTPAINLGMPDEDDLERRGGESMFMTLSDFEAPLTPTSSRPSTPTLPKMSSMTSMDGVKTPPNGLSLESRMPSFDSQAAFNISPPATASQSMDRSDSDGILSSFQFGEATLREAISSIILVVRRREVRTLRVLHRVARVINAVRKRTSDVNASVDLSKIILDELAGVIRSFLKNKRTTIVSIEQMFDNFRAVCDSNSIYLQDDWELSAILSPDTLPLIAADFPKGTGKRRRVHTDDAAPPVEIEDANAFFVITRVYDEALRAAKLLEKLGSLSEVIFDILTEDGVEDSYLDKRHALLDLSDAVRKHGNIGSA